MSARLLLAGVASGVGKTTLTTGLLAAFRRRGLAVQPFKAGPDYLDPTYHELAAGVTGRNLDSWLLPHDRLRALFGQALVGADLGLVEGVMGLYDGVEYLGERGSTAELAKLLGLPVVLVLDVRAQARSAAATVLGFQRLDPDVPLVGVICNRVGSASHYAGVKSAIEAVTGLPVLGGLPRLAAGAIPERHLGLVRAEEEMAGATALVAGLADAVAEGCDLDALLALAASAPPLANDKIDLPAPYDGPRPVIAYARDEAFSFYYPENLALLRHCGADLRAFSPLSDAALPADTDAIYIGGGYPELYADRLSANQPLIRALRAAIAAGIPCYAECGGLMYLTEGLRDSTGRYHELVGVLLGRAVMRERRIQLGYATVRARVDTPLLRAGEEMRGHEFHYSTWEDLPPDLPYAYLAEGRHGGAERPEGFARGNLLASYIHLHFWSNPLVAARFVAAAVTARANRGVRCG